MWPGNNCLEEAGLVFWVFGFFFYRESTSFERVVALALDCVQKRVI